MNDLTNEIKSNARKSFTLEKYPEFGINYKQHFIPFASYIQKLNKDPKPLSMRIKISLQE